MFAEDLAAEINQHLKRASMPPLDPSTAPAPPPEPPGPPPLVGAIQALLQLKYAVLLAYITYGDQLQCVERDGLYTHFQAHISEEREWIYALHRTLASEGAEGFPAQVSVPTAPLQAPRPCLEALLALESQLLDAWAGCGVLLNEYPGKTQGEVSALTAFFQEGARIDLAHLQDLRRYLGRLG